MIRYAIAIFTSAFLIFQVQPIIARYILPWFGGSPAVWSTCLLFFQLGLLAGYAYAHLITTRLSLQRQAFLHCALIFVVFILLPVSPTRPITELDGMHDSFQTWTILKLLFKTVGFPFILLSASAPLLQHWFANKYVGTSPYRLYALSNTGSLLALISYPFLIEPLFAIREQTLWWSIGFVIFGLATLVSAWAFFKNHKHAPELAQEKGQQSITSKNTMKIRPIRWILFSACGSMLLLAITNSMCQDLAAIPFLWIIPLSLYLISFIICFERDTWYQRIIWIPLFAAFTSLLVNHLLQDFEDESITLLGNILIYCGTLFTGVMVCHGELTRSKPHTAKLTSFYLFISLGGAIGGIFVNLIAPTIFSGFWELHVSLLSIAFISTISLIQDKSTLSNQMHSALSSASGAGSILLAVFLWMHVGIYGDKSIHDSRGFFGVLHVYDNDSETHSHHRSLVHGRIRHGNQWFSPELENQPCTYFTENSGVGIAINHHPLRKGGKSMHIGVTGLGIGTISALCNPGDSIRFYEINNQVITLANEYFTYLKNSKADVEIILGDARLTLEKEVNSEESNRYDVLVLDAFSGDAIPIHLLTEQSFDLYRKHLKKDGILAIHITNLYVDLSDVVRNLAKKADLPIHYIVHDGDDGPYDDYNEWVLITENKEFIADKKVQSALSDWNHELKDIHWTDDFSNLFETVIW